MQYCTHSDKPSKSSGNTSLFIVFCSDESKRAQNHTCNICSTLSAFCLQHHMMHTQEKDASGMQINATLHAHKCIYLTLYC